MRCQWMQTTYHAAGTGTVAAAAAAAGGCSLSRQHVIDDIIDRRRRLLTFAVCGLRVGRSVGPRWTDSVIGDESPPRNQPSCREPAGDTGGLRSESVHGDDDNPSE